MEDVDFNESTVEFVGGKLSELQRTFLRKFITILC